MAVTPILNYKGKYDGPEIDKAVELALGLENPKSCPYYVHISLSKPDYVLTIGLGDAEGNLFNHAEIDLPLESMVVNATYENGNIILHLQDGTTTEPIPISALIAGLVSETRTIAGIDLKDDITQKELRDALDVYTKDSVDQLVSDLEDRIDETLNEMKQSLDDLEERVTTNEEATNTNKSDILNMKSKMLISSSKTVSGTNWYRVFSITPKGTSRTGLIIINRTFSNNSPENYLLSFSFGQNLNEINLIKKLVENVVQLIDSIRVVYANSGPNAKELYIDIHYISNSSNPIYTSILFGTDTGYNIVPVNYTIAEIPEDYTSEEFDLTDGDVFDRLTALETALAQIQTQ